MVSENEATQAPSCTRSPSRTGGWLILFFLFLMVVFPLSMGVYMVRGIRVAGPYLDAFPQLTTVLALEGGLHGVMILASVFVGVILWLRRPDAIAKAKRFLMLYLMVSIFGPTLRVMPALLLELPGDGITALVKTVPVHTVIAVLGFSIWNAYLERSQRVKHLYDDCLAAKGAGQREERT